MSISSQWGKFIFLVVLLLFPLAGEARSYSYGNIRYDITVNSDTTVRIIERQSYNFIGEYHQGWRSIPHDKLDEITDISIRDGMSDEPLVYSSSRLDKDHPSSWGKYTTWIEDGATNIEWYYDLSSLPLSGNTDIVLKDWIISYTVHGGLSFYEDFDELYWNLFTDYRVPVYRVTAHVHLPGVSNDLQTKWYVTNPSAHIQNIERIDDTTVFFGSNQFAPGEDATIALGWQKGLVDESAYWRYFWERNWPYPASAFLILFSIVFAVAHWYYTERHNKGRGTIVPEYEPPLPIPPAMAELIVRERITRRTWPATVIDLATRGYLKIEEIKSFAWGNALLYGVVLLLVIPAILFVFMSPDSRPAAFIILMGPIAFALFIYVVILKILRANLTKTSLTQSDYLITRTAKDSISLEAYEQEFLHILVPAESSVFSTKELRRSTASQQEMYRLMKILEKNLRTEISADIKIYEKSLAHEQSAGGTFLAVVFVFVTFNVFVFGLFKSVISLPHFILVISIFLSVGIILYRLFFDARLSKEGHIIREKWLGFKMYLETAEKYRLQNLTPELFEKYLPYAMIFGVEKKWARAFNSLNLQPPSWYHGTSGAYVGSMGGSGFSAGSFAGGFSASFISSFASSGASGASAGGGGAGGGGGGGGGGAS